MGRKTALWLLATVMLTGCGDDLSSLYDEEGYAGTFGQGLDDASVLQGTADLQDTAVPERIPAAPLMATAPPPGGRLSLRLFCSPSARYLFGDDLEESFEGAHPRIDLVLLEEHDRACIGNVITQNSAAIVGVPLSSNEIKHGLIAKVLGYRIAVVVAHPSNTVSSLFSDGLQKVLDGRINNWRDVGWQALPIQPVCEAPARRDDPAAKLLQMTGKAAEIAVLLPDGDRVLDYVSREPRALGLVAIHRYERRREDVRALEINDMRASVANYLRGAYPLGCTFRLIYTTEWQPGLAELLRFLRTSEAKRILESHLTLPSPSLRRS